jgi:hypothetical protein
MQYKESKMGGRAIGRGGAVGCIQFRASAHHMVAFVRINFHPAGF